MRMCACVCVCETVSGRLWLREEHDQYTRHGGGFEDGFCCSHWFFLGPASPVQESIRGWELILFHLCG